MNIKAKLLYLILGISGSLYSLDLSLQSAFIKAIIDGDAAKVEKLISRGVHINEYSIRYKSFALIEAAMYNRLEITKFLIMHGAEINITSESKGNMTALHYIVKMHEADLQMGVSGDNFKKSVDLIQYLLEHGANPYLKNNDGQNVFDLAGNDERIVRILTIYYKPKPGK